MNTRSRQKAKGKAKTNMQTDKTKQTASATPEKVRNYGLWVDGNQLGHKGSDKRTIPAEKSTGNSWLWPDRTIGKGESRQLREDHNALVNAFDLSQHNLASWEQAAMRNAAHAAQLAEALRGTLAAYKAVRPKPLRIVAIVESAHEALAAYESEMREWEERANENRDDLRDAGRNDDGSGESISERNQ